ncbi:MAG: hypothetical protein Q8L11_00110 [Candidatus Moranbacteria bacterium]|nr:hypothetical protein [Candidatus Moranbacteria bacterium]
MKVAIMINGPVGQALKQTIGLFGEVEFVEDPYLANVVIAEDAKTLIPYYCMEREFIIMPKGRPRGDQEAKNVHEYGILDAIQIMTFPAMQAKQKLPETLPGPPEVVAKRIESLGAKRVLVVDDTVKHQKSALVLLDEYDLTIATGYDEAMRLLASEKFDVVLTDMEMPMAVGGALATYILGKKIPYGLLIATEAARVGVKQVGVVTDLGHHDDPFSAAFDHFSRYDYEINGAIVKYMHAPMITMDGESAKDWSEALKKFNK